MSWKQYSEGCPGCRPVAAPIDFSGRVGSPLPPAHPLARAIERAWAETDLRTRRAFHDFTCNNSRRKRDLELVADFRRRIHDHLELGGALQ